MGPHFVGTIYSTAAVNGLMRFGRTMELKLNTTELGSQGDRLLLTPRLWNFFIMSRFDIQLIFL